MTPARHDKGEVAALHSDLQANIFVGTHTLQKERNDPSGGDATGVNLVGHIGIWAECVQPKNRINN